MKRYNSVFTIAVSIDHNMEDASDITKEGVHNAIVRRLEDVWGDDPMETLVTGPDDTTETIPDCIPSFNFGDIPLPRDAEWGRLPEEDVSFPVGEHLRVVIYANNAGLLKYTVHPAHNDEVTLENGFL